VSRDPAAAPVVEIPELATGPALALQIVMPAMPPVQARLVVRDPMRLDRDPMRFDSAQRDAA
jgi:hypothetical protein